MCKKTLKRTVMKPIFKADIRVTFWGLANMVLEVVLMHAIFLPRIISWTHIWCLPVASEGITGILFMIQQRANCFNLHNYSLSFKQRYLHRRICDVLRILLRKQTCDSTLLVYSLWVHGDSFFSFLFFLYVKREKKTTCIALLSLKRRANAAGPIKVSQSRGKASERCSEPGNPLQWKEENRAHLSLIHTLIKELQLTAHHQSPGTLLREVSDSTSNLRYKDTLCPQR